MKHPFYPWTELARSVDLDSEENQDLGGDPYDIGEGDICLNEAREVRIVLGTYTGHVRWLNMTTGVVHDEPKSSWSKWAGEQVWFLQNRNSKGWTLRSPFDNGIEYTHGDLDQYLRPAADE